MLHDTRSVAEPWRAARWKTLNPIANPDQETLIQQVGKAHLALGRAYQCAGPELSDKAEAALQRACDVCAQLRAAHSGSGDAAAGVRPTILLPASFAANAAACKAQRSLQGLGGRLRVPASVLACV